MWNKIGNSNYNIMCYAADLLLCSTTVSGLQSLIDLATKYIVSHGLRFNPSKSVCRIHGANPFTSIPKWTIGGETLQVLDTLPYLGATFEGHKGHAHIQARVRAAQISYYSLQGVRMCFGGLEPIVSAKISSTVICPTLLYGCPSIYMSETNKSRLRIKPQTHSTLLLEALNILPIKRTLFVYSLDLMRSCLLGNSQSNTFYNYLIKNEAKIKMSSYKTLVGRIEKYNSNTSNMCNVNITKYVLNVSYRASMKAKLTKPTLGGIKCVVDSIRTLITNYSSANRDILYNLLKPF